MRLHLSLFPARVGLDNVLGVQGDFLEGVDSNEDNAGVRVDGELRVAFADCVENRGFIDEGQIAEIIGTF